MTKEEIREYLRENLKISFNENYDYEHSEYNRSIVRISIYLENEIISESKNYIYRPSCNCNIKYKN